MISVHFFFFWWQSIVLIVRSWSGVSTQLLQSQTGISAHRWHWCNARNVGREFDWPWHYGQYCFWCIVCQDPAGKQLCQMDFFVGSETHRIQTLQQGAALILTHPFLCPLASSPPSFIPSYLISNISIWPVVKGFGNTSSQASKLQITVKKQTNKKTVYFRM